MVAVWLCHNDVIHGEERCLGGNNVQSSESDHPQRVDVELKTIGPLLFTAR